MTLQELITKITEAENSLSKSLEKDDTDFAVDYLEISQKYLAQLAQMKDSLSPEDLATAKEFAQAYSEHIKDQIKLLAVEQAKVGQQFRSVKNRHRISNKYTQIRKATK